MRLYSTLLSVALGSALTLLGAFALERKRVATARVVELRDSCLRWPALRLDRSETKIVPSLGFQTSR